MKKIISYIFFMVLFVLNINTAAAENEETYLDFANGSQYVSAVSTQSIISEVECDRCANLFTDAEQTEFNIKLENIGNEEKNCKIQLNVKDESGNIVFNTQEEINVPSKEKTENKVYIHGIKNGFYTAEIIVSYGNESYIHNIDFAVVKAPSETNSDSIFGTCLHISGLKKDSERLNSMMYMLKNSGIDYIRDEYYWDHVELEKGKYTFYADDYIDACVENGIKPLVVLSYSNKFYGVPHNEEGYKAFAAYAAALAEHLKGKVDCFEVWNEWNGGTWSGGYGVEEYANILKYTYEAIKDVDKNITVVAGATITAASNWFDSLFSITKDGKSMFEYCDAISYHPYCIRYSPDMKKESGSVEDNFQKMYNMMQEYGMPKPQWITEYGWYTGNAKDNVSPEVQANYITRAYISGMAYGVEKIFAYDFKNDGINLNNSENNYGIIASWDESEEIKYKPKPAYLATAAVSQMLKNMEFVKEYRPKENIRMYKFQNSAQNREIYAIYSADDSTEPFLLSGDNLKLKCYDIYGNECRIKEISASPMYIEGEIGEFKLDGFITEFRSRATATFGAGYKYDGIQVLGRKAPYKAGIRNAYAITSQDESIICDIDDAWIFSNSAELKLSVDYYDSGSDSFYIEYKSADGSVKRTESVVLNDTENMNTVDFVLSDINASNLLEGGDFKITSDSLTETIRFIAVRAEEPNAGVRMLSADFHDSDFKNMNGVSGNYRAFFDGLVVMAANNPNGAFEYVEKAGRCGVYVPAVNDGYYLAVNLSDEILYGGLNDLTVDVDYYDEGNGNFDIAYDGGDYSFQHPSGNVVYLNNTKEWKTASFRLDKVWLENHGVDFRVALWTGRMPTSSEGITFGGIRIRSNKDIPSFKVSYDEKEQKIKISGYFLKEKDEEQSVTIQILQRGKTNTDIALANNDNINSIVRYFAEVSAQEHYNYKYFEKEFRMEDSSGVYLIRVCMPGSNVVAEKYLYYYNLYDVDNLVIRDKNGNTLDKSQISGIDYMEVSTDFLSNYDDTDVCMLAAVYDDSGRMCGVDFVEETAVAGEIKTLKTAVSLNSKIEKGFKIKLFILKDLSAIVPLTGTGSLSAR